jgi:DNA-directed RNA polymerase subunit H (RpoH/RPB5)
VPTSKNLVSSGHVINNGEFKKIVKENKIEKKDEKNTSFFGKMFSK